MYLSTSASTSSSLSMDLKDEQLRSELRLEVCAPLLSIPPRTILLPTLKLNKFEDIKLFGRGKKVTYFSASLWGSTVIIKVFKDDNELERDRQLLERMCHTSILKILGIGASSSRYIIVEMVEGETLDEFIYRRTVYASDIFSRLIYGIDKRKYLLHYTRVLSIVKQVFSALKYLHEEVHPDFTIIHGGNLL